MNADNISANYLEALVAALKKKQLKKHLGLGEDAQPESEGAAPEGIDSETLELLQQVSQMPATDGEVEIQSLKVKPEEDEEME